MRGHTSLMVTEDTSDSDEESKGEEEDDDEGGQRTSVAPELGSSSAEPEWGSTAGRVFTPNWGNHPIQDPRDQEFANYWTNRSAAYYRKSRNEVMERGVHLHQNFMKTTSSLKDAPGRKPRPPIG